MSNFVDLELNKETIMKTKFNSLNPAKFFSGIKNKILHHNGTSKKKPKKINPNLCDEIAIIDKSCNNSISKNNLIDKSLSSFSSSLQLNPKRESKRKYPKIFKSKNSIFRKKSHKGSVNISKELSGSKHSFESRFKFSHYISRDPKPKYNINSSVDSLGCSTADLSSEISSFSTSSIGDPVVKIDQNNKPIKRQHLDQNFRNELEKIFSGTKTNKKNSNKKVSEQILIKSKLCQKPSFLVPRNSFHKTNFYEKLRDFIALLSGTLIRDYSDLLVDHENKLIITDDHLSNEESLKSLLNDSSSLTELSDSNSTMFNLLLKPGNQIGFDMSNALFDEDKMLKMLISMLVKSCRIFDVATIKTDYTISYWRYANPVIAVLKYGRKKQENVQKIDRETQTCDLMNSENTNTIATETNFCTVIDLKQDYLKTEDLTESLLEIVSESLMLSTLHDDQSSNKDHIYENEVFLNFFNKIPIYENCEIIKQEEIKKSNLDKSLEILIKDVEKKIFKKINEPALYENCAFLEKNNNFLIEEIGENAVGHLKINDKFKQSNTKFLFGRRINSHNGSLVIRKSSNTKSNNRAQDETLRDAEDLSDLENESDIDQWIDLTELKQELFLINNERDKKDNMPIGDMNHEKKYELKKLNENFDPKSNIGHKKEKFRKNSKLSLSPSSSSSSTSLSQLTSNYSKNILINSFQKSNCKKPKSTNNNNNNNNNNNSHNKNKKSKFKIKTNSNSKSNTTNGRVAHQYCLYKKDKNKKNFFNFTHFDNNKKNIFAKNIHPLSSIMHEYENTKSLETFLKKYESQTYTTKSETKFKNFFKNNPEMDVCAPRLRTHSLDSLEEEKNEEFTVECRQYEIDANESTFEIDVNVTQIDGKAFTDETPEIKIDFEYQIVDDSSKRNRSEKQLKSATYSIGDLKSSSKFNEETIVKQRARESLKFWKTEEEKFKQESDIQQNSSSSNIVQSSNLHAQNSMFPSLKRVDSKEKRINSNSDSNNDSQDFLNENNDQQVPSKRVKDRINIFESKFQENKSNSPVMNFLKIKKGERANFEKETKSTSNSNSLNSYNTIIEKKSSNTIQSRIESLENKNDKSTKRNNFRDEKSERNSKNEDFCSHIYIDSNQGENVTSSKKIHLISDSSNIVKIETLERSQSFDSDKNQVEETFFENQIIEYRCEKSDNGQIKISTCSLDKKKTISLSLNSLNSEYVLDTEDQQKTEEKIMDNYQYEKSTTHVSILEEKHSSISLQNSEVKSDESEEEEEVEIVIDLTNDTKNVSDEDKINETLRNIVMHLIPTTRKAYVDDIVDGIKSQISSEELIKIDSPMDLPKQVIRFVQKRYTCLLNENFDSEKQDEMSKQTSIEILLDSDRDSIIDKERSSSPFIETTELTVVKEIRKEIMSSSESEMKTEVKEDNFLKVDEDTLYIVEKIRQIKNKTEEEEEKNNEIISHSTSFVDNEIRKNFELKPKTRENGDQFRPRDIKVLINDLKKSIFKSNLHFSEMQSHGLINEINDYQLHYFNLNDSIEKEQPSILVILFDKQNEENLKYNLEQNYQKSIIETHLSLNKKANINIVAQINLFYIDDIDSDVNLKDDFYESHASYINLVNNSKFYEFSIFKRLKDAHQLSHLNDVSTFFLPIGKYFVRVQYKHVIHTNDLELNKVINETQTEKESIVDLSLLPLAIRAQLIFQCEQFMDKKTSTDLPEVNILAVDSFLLQMEINKKRDDLIRNIIVKQFNYTPQQAEEFLCKKKSFNELENLNDFINRLEADLDSYYICEKVESLNQGGNVQKNNEDLVKLNKLDALASFKCVQKYKMEIFEILKNPKEMDKQTNNLEESFKKFYLIDNGNHYKCMLPIDDLIDSNDQIEKSVNNEVNDSSVVIENIQKRQNYIFNRDLQNVFNNGSSPSPSSEISKSTEPVSTQSIEKNSSAKSEDKVDFKQKNNNQKTDIQNNNDPKLELYFENLNMNDNSRDLRDKIIANEVYNMFNTIRDHQSSTVKAKGEMKIRRKKKRAGTWSYSSNKRHVIAKVMELPYVEDMTQLTKKTGIADLKDLEKSILNNNEDTSEKVFVRIDDFLNKKVSQLIQRSYSFDYLNKDAGPKFRIKYVKIPSQEIKAHNLYYEYPIIVPETGEYRTAPYNLRYLSILKLLEEERLCDERYFENLNDPCLKQQVKNITENLNNNKNTKPCVNDVRTKKDIENFLSKNNIDEEIKKVKEQAPINLKKMIKNEIKYPTNPAYIIKEKTTKSQNNNITLNRIDSELKKSDKSSLTNQSQIQDKTKIEKNLGENVRIYDLPDSNLNVLMDNKDLYKNYSSNDCILYYDYETSNLLSVNPNTKYLRSESKNQNEILKNFSQDQNSPKVNGVKNCQSHPQSPYFTRNNVLILNNNKNDQTQEFSDELLKSQQNLYQIVDFQEKVISSALNRENAYLEAKQKTSLNKTTEHFKSNPNLAYQSKNSNLQNLIIPNQAINSFENELKSKRNI